jgi:hypothetical protein
MTKRKDPSAGSTPYWCNNEAKGKFVPGENYEDTDTKTSLMLSRGYRFVRGKWVP